MARPLRTGRLGGEASLGGSVVMILDAYTKYVISGLGFFSVFNASTRIMSLFVNCLSITRIQ